MKSMRKNTWLPLIGLRTFLFVTTAFTIVSCSDDKGEDGVLGEVVADGKKFLPRKADTLIK